MIAVSYPIYMNIMALSILINFINILLLLLVRIIIFSGKGLSIKLIHLFNFKLNKCIDIYIMGNLCCFFCKPSRCVKCGVPYNYYSDEEHRGRPSCRGDYPNDYPNDYKHHSGNGYHQF